MIQRQDRIELELSSQRGESTISICTSLQCLLELESYVLHFLVLLVQRMMAEVLWPVGRGVQNQALVTKGRVIGRSRGRGITWHIFLSILSPIHYTSPYLFCRLVQFLVPVDRLGWGPSTASKLIEVLQKLLGLDSIGS